MLDTNESDNNKAELIDKSKLLIELFGFEEGKKVNVAEIREKIDQHQSQVKDALILTFEHINPDIGRVLANQPDVQLAYLLNIQKMVEYNRFRRDGSPYFVHPQMVSQKLVEHAPESESSRIQGVVGALLHDYIEEGDQISPEIVAELRNNFDSLGREMAEELILLTEPNYIEKGEKKGSTFEGAINYDELGVLSGKGRKTLETAMFGLMMSNSKLMQLVVPVDKLDNVLDCDVVQKRKAKKAANGNAEVFAAKYLENIAKTLSTYLFYAENCVDPESWSSKEALEKQVQQKIETLVQNEPELASLETVISAKLSELRAVLANSEVKNAMQKQLRDYYGSLGLNEFADKLQ